MGTPGDFAPLPYAYDSSSEWMIPGPSQSTSPTCQSAPFADKQHMDWLESYQPINEFDGLPADLDKAADDVDWGCWARYLDGEDDADLTKASSSASPPALAEPKMYHEMSAMTPPPSFDGVLKQEECDDELKPFAGFMDCHNEPNYDARSDITEPALAEAEELDVAAFPLPLDEAISVSAKPKTKRGRPKKIRAPEDRRRMSVAERRKALNRDAALRYRERRKAEHDQMVVEQETLSRQNAALRLRVKYFEDQIALVRSNLRLYGCPI